jgi:hypothetical protein
MMSAIFSVYGCILYEFVFVQYPTSGFTCAMGFSPFIARMRFFTAQVAWRTTLS